MVNIQSVVIITDNLVISYNSFDSYWAALMGTLSPERKAQQLRALSNQELTEKTLAKFYNIPEPWIKNCCFIFATMDEARHRMADEYTRRLICDPHHRVVVQIRALQGKTITISTIYRPFDHEIITAVSRNPLALPVTGNEQEP